MPEMYPYQHEWEDFRFRSALPFLTFPLWIAAIVVYAVFGDYLRPIESLIGFSLMLGIFVALGVFAFASTTYLILYRCPACRKYFGIETALDLVISKPYRAKKCKNCGLPKYHGSTFLAEKYGETRAKEISEEWKARTSTPKG